MTNHAPGQREQPRAAQLIELGDFSMSSQREGDVHTIALFGELDLATVETVEHELGSAEATDAGSIVVDLSGLTFMDSDGVRVLLAASARSRADTERLALRRGPPTVQRVLGLCGVEASLPFAD